MLASICGSRSQKPRKQYSRTVKRLFTGFQTNFQRLWRNMERKPLKSHATVVGGQATVGRLSINDFSTFQAIRNFLKKSLNGHSTVVGGHATVGRLSNNVFWTFQAFRKKIEKSRWTVTRQWSEVTRQSADCQTTFLDVSSDLEKILKKVADRSRDSGWGHATVGRLSNNVFWTFQAIRKKLKKVAERSRDSGRRSRDRRLTVKQRFLDVSSDLGKFWKKSLNGHATVVGGHATVGRLSNNVFWTFQAIWENFWKKSLNGHATVVGGHATVGRLSNNVFWTCLAICENFEKSRWTVTRQKVGGHATVGRLSNNDFSTFQAIRIFFEKSR